ncbi:helix-turn-helix domain-containing protein [Pseudoalteromonas sp. NGC95]|uniref:helix-turn-helix domain-containing protein n=1 Tax=Pseudoalteromonas sp. NGC95 TaxID=2792051 RepID=UPI0018CF4F4E|nr:helix-turn-helix transcriptional regulator [Pseudoalteromonas sp. NGC95]
MEQFSVAIGKNIKVMRARREVSQAELAFKAGLNQSYLSRVENGSVNITVLKLKTVSDALQCNIRELLPEI